MTFQELLDAEFVEHHKCGACGSSVGYLIHPEMAAAVFNSGCGCSSFQYNYRLLTRKELEDIPSIKIEPSPDRLKGDLRYGGRVMPIHEPGGRDDY